MQRTLRTAHVLVVAILSTAVGFGCQGPKGDTGPQGDAGPQGPKGDTGPQGPPGIPNVAVYDATSPWTAPASVTRVEVELWGGGGGGEGQTMNLPTGFGGCAGGYAKGVFTVVPGTTYTATVGSGGHSVPDNMDQPGGDGGASSFGSGSPPLIMATGGGGGSGTCAGGVGTVAGAAAGTYETLTGGVGRPYVSGIPAGVDWSGGASPRGGAVVPAYAPGLAPGGGGGGGNNNAASGAGAPGRVIVRW